MRRALSICLFLCCLGAVVPAAAQTPFARWADLHGAVSGWRLDSLQVSRVQSLILERDAGTLVLEEGRLALARPIGGRICAAAFQGRGTFRYAPRTRFEQDQLVRTMGKPLVRRSFTQLVLVFTDSTLGEWQGSLDFAPDTLGALSRVWKELAPHLTQRDDRVLRPLPVAYSLANRDSGLFWASVWSAREEPLYLVVDPYATESVQLHQRPEDDRRGLWRQYRTEIVSQQTVTGEPDTALTDVRPPFTASAYTIRATIGTDLKAEVTAEVRVEAEARKCEWLPFALQPRLRLSGVECDGRRLEFQQEKERNAVWVRIEPALEPGSVRTLRFQYEGPLLERLEQDWIALASTSDWYPRAAFAAPATWDMTFAYPAGMQLLAPGTRTEDRLAGSVRHARWVLDRPTPRMAFELGYYRGIEVVDARLPALTVWTHHVDRAGKVERRTLSELETSRRPDDRVALDVARTILSMQRLFGPALAASWNAVETPRLRFEAYPGLVELMPIEHKRLPGAEYSPEWYRYHEIAHQWWGLTVEPARDRDLWLAEGVASFLAIHHPAKALGQTGMRAAVLQAWREQLESGRRYRFGAEPVAGPIALGTRVRSSATPDDHQAILYMKSAWVLERLRCALRRDDHDQDFERILSTFVQRYAGRRASTEDLLRVAEEVTSTDLHPYFQSFVYGVEPLEFVSCP